MAIRDIITIPDPVLKTVSAALERVGADERKLFDDMLETMYDAPGIGLAAIQVGIAKRMIVIDLAKDEEPADPMFMVNPEITWASGELVEYEEGCLSIPEVYDKVTRPAEVGVRYVGRDGEEIERQCSGLLATCVQHEIDHLNGILFIDHLSRLKRDRVVKKFTKAARQAKEVT